MRNRLFSRGVPLKTSSPIEADSLRIQDVKQHGVKWMHNTGRHTQKCKSAIAGQLTLLGRLVKAVGQGNTQRDRLGKLDLQRGQD